MSLLLLASFKQQLSANIKGMYYILSLYLESFDCFRIAICKLKWVAAEAPSKLTILAWSKSSLTKNFVWYYCRDLERQNIAKSIVWEKFWEDSREKKKYGLQCIKWDLNVSIHLWRLVLYIQTFCVKNERFS